METLIDFEFRDIRNLYISSTGLLLVSVSWEVSRFKLAGGVGTGLALVILESLR